MPRVFTDTRHDAFLGRDERACLVLDYMLRTGEIAPGDVVGWRDYFTDAVTRIGLCVVLTRMSTMVWWNDGTLCAYDADTADALLGTTIYALLQLPDASSAACLEAPEGGIIDT